MQEYLVMQLVILLLMSLVLVASHSFFKSRIYLRTRTVFSTIGVSFILGAFFPWVLSTFTLSMALLIYLGIITLFAFAFSYCDLKITARGSANPVMTTQPENEITGPAPAATSTAFEFNEEIALTEACATLDCTAVAAEAENNMASGIPNTGSTSLVVSHTAHAGQIIPADELSGTMSEADPASDETQPDQKTVHGGDICRNSAVPGGAHLQSTQDIFVEFSLPVSENTPEAGWRKETLEPAKAVSAAAGVTGKYGLTPGQGDVVGDAQEASQRGTLEGNEFIEDKLLPSLEAAEEHFERCDLPAMELSPETNEIIPAKKTSAAGHAPMDDFNNSDKNIYTSLAEGLPPGAGPAYTGKLSEELTKGRTAVGNSKPAAKPVLPPQTINDNISAGFAAKASGDMATALVSFINAFRLNQEPHAAVALAVEISNIYQELGHYPQAKLFIKSLLEQEHLNVTPLRQQLEYRLLYLDTLNKLLEVANMPNAPYSKVPNLVKIKANIDTTKRNNQGGI